MGIEDAEFFFKAAQKFFKDAKVIAMNYSSPETSEGYSHIITWRDKRATAMNESFRKFMKNRHNITVTPGEEAAVSEEVNKKTGEPYFQEFDDSGVFPDLTREEEFALNEQ